jgi:integrase
MTHHCGSTLWERKETAHHCQIGLRTPLSSGSLRKLKSGGYEARIELGKPLGQKAFELAVDSEEEGKERKALLNRLAKALREAGHQQQQPILLGVVASSRGVQLATAVRAIELMCSGKTAPVVDEPSTTFREVADMWVGGELHQRFPDHVQQKADATLDESRLEKLCAIDVGGNKLGDIPVDKFKLEHAEAAMRALPASAKSPRTRHHYLSLMNRVLALAVYPCKLIQQSPLPKHFMPKVTKPPARSFLYPAEEAALLRCRDVPLTRRVLYGLLAREGCRRSEAAGLTWRDIDLERGVLTLDKNKTDDARAWGVDPSVVQALRAWRELYYPDAEAEHPVFVAVDGSPLEVKKLSRQLKRDLLAAKVDRHELFHKGENRAPIRAHDLRGTFVTLALASGRSETWVQDRTGHTTSAMVNRYRRAARSAKELELGILLPMDHAIPELQGIRNESGTETPKNQRSSIKTGGGAGNRTRVRKASRHSSFTCVSVLGPTRRGS